MKRIFAIMAAVALCFALTVPAFAVNVDDLPTPDGLEDYICFDWIVAAMPYDLAEFGDIGIIRFYQLQYDSNLYELRVEEADGRLKLRVCLNGNNEIYSDCRVVLTGIKDGQVSREAVHVLDVPSYSFVGTKILDSGRPIYCYESDDVYFNPNANDIILPAAIPPDSLSGALTEVCGILVYVIPVVAGLFGIRKGIAFLISRIRGV